MIYAPILIPTLCRDKHLIRCIESLKKNSWAKYTDIYVALDYPTKEAHWQGYNKIKEYLQGEFPEFAGFNVIVREENYGSARNMSEMRSDILKKYDRFIRTDDDCEFASNFIEYMDKCLDRYEKDEDVMAVTGYSYPVKWNVNSDANVFKSQCLFSMWGTGFWRNKFYVMQNLFAEPNYFQVKFNENVEMNDMTNVAYDDFVSYGTAYKPYEGLMTSFCDRALTVYLQLENKYIVTPTLSKVRNYGFDGSGVYCLNTLIVKSDDGNSQAYDYQKQIIDKDEQFDICEDRLLDKIGNKKIIDSFDGVPRKKLNKLKIRCFLYRLLGSEKYITFMRKCKKL